MKGQSSIHLGRRDRAMYHRPLPLLDREMSGYRVGLAHHRQRHLRYRFTSSIRCVWTVNR